MFDTSEQAPPVIARAPRREPGWAAGSAVRDRRSKQASTPVSLTGSAATLGDRRRPLDRPFDPTGHDTTEAARAESGVAEAYRTFWSDLGIFLVVIVLSVLIARAQGFA